LRPPRHGTDSEPLLTTLPPTPHPATILSATPHSHSMVAGGFELTSYTTRFTPLTSLIIRLLISPRTSGGNANQSAVIPSRLVTARSATTWSYVRPSPITPTDLIGRSTANACQIWSYSPAARISSTYVASTRRSRSSRSSVTSPSTRIASPGPGNGCRPTISSGSPSSRPTCRTSSL